MNYSGKFDAKVPVGDSGSNGHVHVDTFSAHAMHAPADAIVVPDAHLLFNGDFKRSGVDLVLSKDDQELVLHDYFKGEKRAALASPDGAHLTGDIVNALTGHIEFAQADGSASVGKVIGHVTKLVGTATCVRNGVSIVLNAGDNVEKGDVVQSGAASTLGITFIDGTVFGLSSNARMVLNEMVYDPNGSNNSSLLSLVAGTITFVAGETAKHGDMKIDTPVATMGIRGTAVLVEIDFDVPGQAGLPDAKFQVLVEPDGTTGSYILFDKTTLTPLAVVDKAGQQINISNGTLTLSSTGLSPEIQKLITDVFSIKFSDSNTKTLDHHTDTPIPDSLSPLKVGVITALPIVLQLPAAVDPAPLNSVVLPNPNVHINQAPTAVILNASGQVVTGFQITELPAVTHSSALDTASGKVSFVDINVGDDPTVSTKFASFTYQNAAHTDVTATLSAQQLADIVAVEAKLTVVPEPGNSYFGSATWTYGVPDGAFDFLAKGETLTLTYTAYVDNNYKQSDLVTPVTFTITITGTNDVPVITSPQQNINFVSAGTDTKGGELIPNTATAGKLTFTDPDLTDTHTVAVKMTSALLDGQSFATTVGPVVIDELAAALTAKITTADDTTGTGTGTVEWALANLQVYLADLVPANESLVLTYAVTVTDSQKATSTQDIVVRISGNNGVAVVWTDTNPIPPGGALWSVASNWEGDRTPNSNGFSDDVFIGTDQVLPATPTFPVAVDAMAAAKSLTMDYFTDFGTAIPELDVESTGTLTIAGALSLDTSTDPLSPLTAESIIKNFGNISVGGIATLLKHSVLDNYGTFTLAQGGVFGDHSSITNSGTIELIGGTLDVEVAVANTGGTVKVDVGATASGTVLQLDDKAVVSDGNLTIGSHSKLDVEKGAATLSAGTPDATLDGVMVTGSGTTGPSASLIEIGANTTSGSILTLDDGTTIKNGTLTIAGGSTLDVESRGGATLDGVSVTGTTGSAASLIEIGAGTTIGSILTLDDATSIKSGTLTIADGSTVDVESTGGATLDGVSVTGTTGPTVSLVEIGASTTSGSILTLDDGTSIKNVNLTIAGGSKLDVESTGGATLDGVSVTGTTGPTVSLIEIGAITASGSILTLDDATSIKNGGLTIAGGSKLDVESIGGATLDGVSVTGATGPTVSLIDIGASTASGSILTLDDGTSIKSGPLTIAGGSTLDIETTGGSTLDGVTVTGSGTAGPSASLIEIGASTPSGSILTLDDATSIKNGGLTIAGGSTLDVESIGGATLDGVSVTGATGPSASLIEIGASTASGSILTLDDGTSIKNGDLTIAGGSTLDVESTGGATLDGVNVMNSGSIQVDSPVSGTTTVTLVLDDGTTVTGGTLTIHVLGSSAEGIVEIATGGATLDSVTVENNNSLLIDSSVTLTLDDSTTISGGIITDNGTIHVTGPTEISSASLNIAAGGFLLVDSSEILKLDGVTVTGGTINDNGTIDVVGSSSINGTTSGAPPATTNAILNDGGVTIESGVTLTLDNVTVTGTVFTDIATSSTIKVGSGDTLAFNGATINGGTLNVLGEMDSSGISFITGATIVNVNHIVVSGMLTIDPTRVTNTGTIEVKGDSTLVLSDEAITNTDGITNGIIQVDDNPINFATLDLDKSAISGGTVIISGVLDSSDDSFITGAKITNSGTIDVISGTLVIDATSTLDNTGGTLKSDGGNLIVDTAFSGNLEIKGGALLELGANSPYSSVTVTFDPDATGTLKLDHSEAFGGTVTGLDDNTIDLLDITSVNAVGTTVLPTVTFDSKTDILTITSNAQLTQVAHIQLTGDYTGVTWSVTNDGNGGTDVTEVPGGIAGLDSNGNATEGSPITASITDGGAAVTATYTWQIFESGAWVPGSGVADANGNYTPGEADEGHALRVSISYIDALNHSETATVSAGTVIGVPETPVVSTPDAKITTENHAAIALTGLSVTPADASANDAADTFNVTLSVNDGSLALADHSGLSGTFSGISITFSGSLAAVNAALSGVSYTPTSEFEGQDTLTFTSSTTEEAGAGGGTSAAATQTATITVNPVAEAGTATAPATLTLTENATNVAITGVSVGPLAEDSDDTVSAALTVGHGTVHVNNTNLPADVTVTGDDSGSLTISSNAAAVDTLLAGLTYTPTTEFNGSDTLLVTVTSKDGSNTSPTQGTASTAIMVSDGPNDLVATLDHTTAQEGVTITVTAVMDGGITVATGLSYKWQDSTNNGWQTVGTGSSYTPGESDEGKLMQLVVTYVDAGGSESSIYSLGMPNDLTATVDSTTAQQGLAIHVTGVSDGGTSISTSSNDLSYAWQHSSDNGETWQTVGISKSYTPTSTDAGDLLQVVVTYADSDEQESVTTSYGTVAPAKEWLGGNHDWQTGSQWATSGVPTNNDNAVVDAGGFYVVKIDHAAAAHSLVVNDFWATVEILAGNTLTLGGNATIKAGILLVDSGATLKDIAPSATIGGTLFIDNGTVEAAGGKLEIATAVNFSVGNFKIDAGAALQLDHADALNVAFTGSGELILNDPTNFHGTISDSLGSMTATDVVDVAGFDANAHVSYFGSQSGGTVTIRESGHTTVHLTVGANSTHWSGPTSDGNGGILIHDPPGSGSDQAPGGVVMQDPGPAASNTIVASAPNQMLTGNAASDTFAFNFANVGHTTVTDFHPTTDTLQFNSQLFANVQAALNATHDDGHGNTVVALDAHDTITLSGVVKAQLHASDFHFV